MRAAAPYPASGLLGSGEGVISTYQRAVRAAALQIFTCTLVDWGANFKSIVDEIFGVSLANSRLRIALRDQQGVKRFQRKARGGLCYPG